MVPNPILFQRTKQVEKTKSLAGPTTRSRANVAHAKDAAEEETSNPIHEEPGIIVLPEPTAGQGSMAAFLAMRKRQKEKATKATATENAPATTTVGVETALPDYEEEEDPGSQGNFLPSLLHEYWSLVCHLCVLFFIGLK